MLPGKRPSQRVKQLLFSTVRAFSFSLMKAVSSHLSLMLDAGWSLIAYFLFDFLWRLAEPWHLVDFPPSFLLLLIMFKSVLSQI